MELKTKINHWAQNTLKKIKVFIYGSDPNISSLKTFQKNHAMNFVTSWGKRVVGWGEGQGGLEMLGCAWESSWCGGGESPRPTSVGLARPRGPIIETGIS